MNFIGFGAEKDEFLVTRLQSLCFLWNILLLAGFDFHVLPHRDEQYQSTTLVWFWISRRFRGGIIKVLPTIVALFGRSVVCAVENDNDDDDDEST